MLFLVCVRGAIETRDERSMIAAAAPVHLVFQKYSTSLLVLFSHVLVQRKSHPHVLLARCSPPEVIVTLIVLSEILKRPQDATIRLPICMF